MVLRSTDGTPRILFLVRILSAAALLTPLLSQPVLAECPEEVWAGDLTTVGVAGMGDGMGGQA